MSVEDTVRDLWKALSARDYALAKSYLADDCIYLDMPTGPTLAARGPENIMKRIKIAWDSLSYYENFEGVVVGNGCDVLYEHSEKWVWPSGETATLPFVTVHKVVNGKITLWKDYWDMATLAGQAPPNWQEDLMKADMSWIFDATGLV